jgi:hypothetical protein
MFNSYFIIFLEFHSNKSYDNFNIPNSSKYLLNLELICMTLINFFAFLVNDFNKSSINQNKNISKRISNTFKGNLLISYTINLNNY